MHIHIWYSQKAILATMHSHFGHICGRSQQNTKVIRAWQHMCAKNVITKQSLRDLIKNTFSALRVSMMSNRNLFHPSRGDTKEITQLFGTERSRKYFQVINRHTHTSIRTNQSMCVSILIFSDNTNDFVVDSFSICSMLVNCCF